MKQINFDNGKITSNILNAALPMLVAQILSLLSALVYAYPYMMIYLIGTLPSMLTTGIECNRWRHLLYHDALHGDSGTAEDGSRKRKVIRCTKRGYSSRNAKDSLFSIL